MTGVNIVGRLSGDYGLAVAARCTIRSLIEGNVPIALANVIFQGHPATELPPEFVSRVVPDITALPYDVTVIHDNIDIASVLLSQFPALRTRVLAIVPFWELAQIPLVWRPVVEQFDVVLCPSNHVRAAFANSVAASLRPITIVPWIPPLPSLPPGVGPVPGVFTFFTSFNTASSVERKNPMAAVHAFARAFPGRTDVALLINCHNNFSFAIDPSQLAAIAGLHPGIRFITGSLDYATALALQNACDVYVSTHRAEGLGLGLLESMAMGKPVIATDYSSTTDFLDETNSAPIRYRLIPVNAPEPVFSAAAIGTTTAMWADPDVDHIAWWMQRLAERRDECERLAQGGLRTIAERRRIAARADWLPAIAARSS